MANFVNVLLNIITSGRRINVKRMKYRKHLHPFSGCFEQPVSFQEVKRLVRNCNILPGVILPTLTLDLSHLLCSQCLKGGFLLQTMEIKGCIQRASCFPQTQALGWNI